MHVILTIFSMVMNAIQIFALVPENHDIFDMIKDMKGILHDKGGDEGPQTFQVLEHIFCKNFLVLARSVLFWQNFFSSPKW